jgi:hypothetical protein
VLGGSNCWEVTHDDPAIIGVIGNAIYNNTYSCMHTTYYIMYSMLNALFLYAIRGPIELGGEALKTLNLQKG